MEKIDQYPQIWPTFAWKPENQPKFPPSSNHSSSPQAVDNFNSLKELIALIEEANSDPSPTVWTNIVKETDFEPIISYNRTVIGAGGTTTQ